MAMRSKSRPTTAGTGIGGEETVSTRKKIQDVLGQARAALRQSQQFRWTTSDKKNNNLSSRLAFQQQQQEDYWSSENAGEVIIAETVNPLYEGTRPHSKSVGKAKSFFNQDNDFGLPFRDTQNKSMSPKILGSTREQQKKEMGKRKDQDKDDASSDTTSVSMNTADLKVTSDSEDSSTGSVGSIRRAPSRISKVSKEVKIIEAPREALVNDPQPSVSAVTTAAITMQPQPSTTLKLTPLKSRHPKIEVDEDNNNDDDDDADSVMDDPGLPARLTRTVTVLSDELGFSRASIKKPTEDPHWFEKALLVRGEPISEAAYKAFKKAHEEQDGLKKKGEALKIKQPKRFPQPPPPPSLGAASSTITAKEPEFTADWISDVDVSSYQSEVDMPVSIQDDLSTPGIVSVIEEHISTIPDLEEDYDDKTIIDEANTESIIRTATELEASGILGEIASNLQNVLEMSEKPVTEDLSRMSAEERTFAREYDEVMLDKDEPLGAIFHSVYSEGEDEGVLKSREDQISRSLGLSNRDASEYYDEEEDEGQYESTFISASENISERSMPTKKSSPTNNTNTKASISRKTLSKSKSSVGGPLTSSPAAVALNVKEKKEARGKEYTLVKQRSRDDTASSMASSQATPQPKITSLTTTTSSSKKKSKSENTNSSKSTTKTSKSRTKTETRTSRQISISRTKSPQKDSTTATTPPPLPPAPLDPPSNRYQKNIHSILEKEVYQKELKRQRSERVRSERKHERQQIIAKESLERNKRTTWKDPTTTEILLPELFKYKSISGLQAAKSKKSEHFRSHPSMNYGAPYFQMSGAVEGSDEHEGTAQMLASAQMETLDIPDLVREVLASNDRMYRMTIEAGREMNRVYKKKMNRK